MFLAVEQVRTLCWTFIKYLLDVFFIIGFITLQLNETTSNAVAPCIGRNYTTFPQYFSMKALFCLHSVFFWVIEIQNTDLLMSK